MSTKAHTGFIIFSSLLGILLFSLVFPGCVHNRVEGFYFIEYSGLKRELVADSRAPDQNGNDLISVNGKLSTPFYSLRQGLEIREPGRSFFIVYWADCPLDLRLKIDGEYVLVDLPNLDAREVEFRYPLDRNALFEGFKLETDVPRGSLKIIGSGVEDSFTGADFTGNPALIGHGIKVLSHTGTDRAEVLVSTDLAGPSGADILQIGMRTDSAGPLLLELKDGDGMTREMELRRPENYRQLSLYIPALGFMPGSITLHGQNTRIETFGLHKTPSVPDPVSMDFASILRYPREKWRRSEYELFRWTVEPKVLVFDFADYNTQAAFLKRLAFFVEKDGFQGRLLTNFELQELHGWNAHDYRAEDMARFFTAAEESAFVLNAEELELREILLSEGILSGDGAGGYRFHTGAVISISRESMDYLRRLFLTHEGFHGLFFTDPGYREHTARLWEGFSPVEKEFWRVFLRWRGYDPEDSYLVQNELQAYLLQQPVFRANTYFIDHTLPRMARLYPQSAGLIDELTANFPNHFEDSAAFLEEYIYSSLGLRGGDLENLKYLY
ncbi:hypothetical protein [Marispirochaeta aestuarii]|uniref:hypothetical protein n=1 Tax=Marispirochaeta aestuarii TaxID=1963862 RepID=UPI002ABE069F|nr:hypothetical protein [Marispirochaeta aestuarii]